MKLKGKNRILLVALLVLALCLGACGGDTSESTVVARVGDVEVTAEQVATYLNVQCLLYGLNPEDFQGEDMAYINDLLRDELVDNILMKLYCEEQGVTIRTDDWDSSLENFLSQVHEVPDAETFMKNYSITDTDLENIFETSYVRTAFMQQMRDETPDLDAQTQLYYEMNLAQYVTQADTLDVAHILVEEEALANDLLAQIKGGADFATLAAENSLDGSAANGGALGPVSAASTGWVAEFDAAAQELQIGEVSDVVESQFGFHILKMNDRIPAVEQQPFAEVASSISDSILNDVYMAKLAELQETYAVEIITPEPADDGAGNDTEGEEEAE